MNIPCDNLDAAIDHYITQLGYRLDMIVPADSPREAILSEPPAVAGDLTQPSESPEKRKQIRLTLRESSLQPPATAGGSDLVASDDLWITGRAGMEYRDLIPGRLNGRLIASHIRLTTGGEVPDYVHYHKVEFQMIYCLRGRINVVYEDQGDPFWLETGDCVLQPPKIRHRVLECAAGAEVIELGMPAEHETWIEHEMTLPTATVDPQRLFNGQRFVRHTAAEAEWQLSEFDGVTFSEFGIEKATAGLARVGVLKATNDAPAIVREKSDSITFLFVMKGDMQLMTSGRMADELSPGNAIIVATGHPFELRTKNGFEVLEAQIKTG